MDIVKQWDDGEPLYISYTGKKTGYATFSSNTNEGLDREATISLKDTNKSVEIKRKVTQTGKREIFEGIELYDGGTFNVLKNEL